MSGYERKFDTIEELDEFVQFQKTNGLNFHWDRVTKRAWILDIDEETADELLQEQLSE